MDELIEFLESAIGKLLNSIKAIADKKPDVVEVKPAVTVNVPKQAAPTVNVPKSPAPVVEFKPKIEAPVITIPEPKVVINSPKENKQWRFKVKYDRDGDIDEIIATQVDA